MPEHGPTNREVDEAHFINELVNTGEISTHEASTMDIDKIISSYFNEHGQKEQSVTITHREFISQERDGYLSDEAVIHLISKDNVTQASVKMAPQPVALETGNPNVQATYKAGIWFEEPKSLDQLKADCAKELKTVMGVTVAEELSEEQRQQLIIQLAHGYKEGYEAHLRELREAVVPIHFELRN